MKLRQALFVIGISVTLCVFRSAMAAPAASSDQQTINALQKQIQSVSTEMHQALAAQQAGSQKAITSLHAQIQTQIAAIQTQMQQMQTQLTNEIKQVQAEMVKAK